jgi:deoxycytidylate deaminase
MKGPCVKQRVTAIIVTPTGERFVGENYCLNAQEACPRAGMASGVGYNLCREICQQVGHAEIVALGEAGEKARGAKLFLTGHTYICESCKAACSAAGIEETIVCEDAA